MVAAILRWGSRSRSIWPEINYDDVDEVSVGWTLSSTTTANTDEEARELLKLFNFPFPAQETEEPTDGPKDDGPKDEGPENDGDNDDSDDEEQKEAA